MSLEVAGFRLVGGEVDVAIEGALVYCLADVVVAPNLVAEGDPIVFDGEERGDFGNGDVGPLGRVSSEVEY